MSDFDLALTMESDEPGFRFKVIRADSGMLPTLAAAFVHYLDGERNARSAFLFETPGLRRIMGEYLNARGYRRDEAMRASWVTICDWGYLVPDVHA